MSALLVANEWHGFRRLGIALRTALFALCVISYAICVVPMALGFVGRRCVAGLTLGSKLDFGAVLAEELGVNFTAPPEQGFQQVLKLISRTRIGNDVLQQFLPRLHRREVKIEAYPDEVLSRLKLAVGRDQPIGACFIPEYKNEQRAGTIYLDATSPLGVLAPFLFHEIIHSLDPEVWEAVRHPLTRKSRDRVLLEAETKAFEAQHQFILELKQRFPEYQLFLKEQYPRAKILHERLTATDVAELYGFKIA